jgi:hypothetical protein
MIMNIIIVIIIVVIIKRTIRIIVIIVIIKIKYKTGVTDETAALIAESCGAVLEDLDLRCV